MVDFETQDVAPTQSDTKELKELKVNLQIAERKITHLEQDYKKLMLENMNLQEENEKLKREAAKVPQAPKDRSIEESKSSKKSNEIIVELQNRVENLKQEKALLQKELGIRKLEMPFQIDVSQVSITCIYNVNADTLVAQ